MPDIETAPGLGAIKFDPSVSPEEQKLIQDKLGAQPSQQFKYVRLPDGSYGKFNADATNEQMRAAVEKQFPDAFKTPEGAKPLFKEPSLQATYQRTLQKPSGIGKIGSSLAPAIAPTALGLAGGYFAGPYGEMAGSGLGEAINQLTGITEKSPMQIGLATAAPGLGRGAVGIGKGIMEGALKTFGGRDILSGAAENVLRKWLSPKVTSDELFKQAEELQSYVPAAQTGPAIEAALKSAEKRIPTAIKDEIIKVLEPLHKYFPTTMGEMRAVLAPDLMAATQDLRRLASREYAAKSGNIPLAQALDEIRNAMLNDLEQSGAGVVREAAKAYRRESALDNLGTLLGKPFPLEKIREFAKKNSLFRDAFNAQEKAQIEKIATKLSSVMASGGSGMFGRGIMGVFGEKIGGPLGALGGVLTPDLFKRLIGTEFGRNFTERILSGTKTITPDIVAGIATFARGLTAPTPEPEQQQNAQ